MTCEICKHMAPISEQMLKNRLANIAEHPEVSIYPCGKCGGTEYMTTREFIKPVEPRPGIIDKLRSLWRLS